MNKICIKIVAVLALGFFDAKSCILEGANGMQESTVIEMVTAPFYVSTEIEKESLKVSIFKIWSYFCSEVDVDKKINVMYGDYQGKTFRELAEETNNTRLLSAFGEEWSLVSIGEFLSAVMVFLQCDNGRLRMVMPDFWENCCKHISPLCEKDGKIFFVAACENLNARLVDCMVDFIIIHNESIPDGIPSDGLSLSLRALPNLFYNILVPKSFIFDIFYKLEKHYDMDILSYMDFPKKCEWSAEEIEELLAKPGGLRERDKYMALREYPHYRVQKQLGFTRLTCSEPPLSMQPFSTRLPSEQSSVAEDELSKDQTPLLSQDSSDKKSFQPLQPPAEASKVKTKGQKRRERRKRARERRKKMK